MKRNLLSIGMLALMLVFSARSFAQNTYTMITSASGLEAGAKYILVGFDDDGNAYAMSYQKSNNRHAVTVSEAGGSITTTVATDPDSQTEVFEFELGGSAGEWTIYDPLREGYLNAPGGGNYLKTQSTLTDNGKWDITIGANGAGVPVSLGAVDQRYMRFNLNAANGTPLFGCYKESSNIIAEVYFFKAGQAQINPQLSQNIYDGLRQMFESQTPLNVIASDGDLQLSGEITSYVTQASSIGSNDNVATNRFTISIKVKFVNTIDPNADFEQSFSRYKDYDASRDFSAVESGLVSEIVNELCEDIFNKAVVNW